MVIVSEGLFTRAIRENAKFCLPKTPIGEVLEYYTADNERVGMVSGHKYWLEDAIVRKMSVYRGQIEG